RFHLSLLGIRHAPRSARKAAGLSDRSDRLHQGGEGPDDGRGLRQRRPGSRFFGARRGDVQALGPGHSGHAATGPLHGMQAAHGGGIRLVRRHQVGQLRHGGRRRGLHPARSIRYFNAWYKKDGPQNYSGWSNEEFNQLVPQIDSEVDAAKRLALIHKAEDILEREVPVFPICWEKINDVWYNYVKGHNPKDYFGIYDVVRMDTMWLDKA